MHFGEESPTASMDVLGLSGRIARVHLPVHATLIRAKLTLQNETDINDGVSAGIKSGAAMFARDPDRP